MVPELPMLGVGFEHVIPWERDVVRRTGEIDCYEILPENFFDDPVRLAHLEQVRAAGVPMVVHGLDASLGSDEPLKEAHLGRVAEIVRASGAVLFSEHLSMTEAGGVEIGQLTPIQWSRASIEVLARKTAQVREIIPLPLVLENITYGFTVPGGEMRETEFLMRVCDACDCYLLLDVNNVWTNSQNHGFDPYRFVDEIDPGRVAQLHLAGGRWEYGMLEDTHDAPVPQPVWELYRYVCQRCRPNAVIIERNSNLPPLDRWWPEYERARAIWREVVGEPLRATASGA